MSYPLLFASGVHDVKNHLNALLMGLNEAYAGADLSRLPELSARCVEMAARLDQLLLLRKTHDEGIQPVADILPLDDLIDNALLECQPIFESRKVTVHRQPDQSGLLVRIDRTLLAVILNNLLYNASVWAASTVSIRIDTPDATRIIIRIGDDGAGFPVGLVGTDLSRALDQDNRGLIQLLGTGLYLCAYSAAAMSRAGIPCNITLANDGGATAVITLGSQPS